MAKYLEIPYKNINFTLLVLRNPRVPMVAFQRMRRMRGNGCAESDTTTQTTRRMWSWRLCVTVCHYRDLVDGGYRYSNKGDQVTMS